VSHYPRMAGQCKHSASISLLLRYFMVASGLRMREGEISVVGEDRRLLVRRGSGAQLQNGYGLLQWDAV
jgi:hypothetical protein